MRDYRTRPSLSFIPNHTGNISQPPHLRHNIAHGPRLHIPLNNHHLITPLQSHSHQIPRFIERERPREDSTGWAETGEAEGAVVADGEGGEGVGGAGGRRIGVVGGEGEVVAVGDDEVICLQHILSQYQSSYTMATKMTEEEDGSLHRVEDQRLDIPKPLSLPPPPPPGHPSRRMYRSSRGDRTPSHRLVDN